jgi:serine/threonine protein kinase
MACSCSAAAAGDDEAQPHGHATPMDTTDCSSEERTSADCSSEQCSPDRYLRVADGDVTIGKLLGSGTYGRVYKAHVSGMKGGVVIKQLKVRESKAVDRSSRQLDLV